MTARVNKIIDFSLVDGAGSRTAIFFQSCNLRCLYCHNPETINLCNSCGVCVPVCPVGALAFEAGEVVWDEKICVACDACIRACPRQSSPKITNFDARELAARISRNMPFISGITCSGGESMLQAEFLTELFAETKKLGLTNFIDTNGTLPLKNYPELIKNTDGVLLDIKCTDAWQTAVLTGGSPEIPLENARFSAERGILKELRTVVTSSGFSSGKTIIDTAEALGELVGDPKITYKLLTYRPFGVLPQNAEILRVPSEKRMEELENLAHSLGFKNVVIV